MTRHRFGQGNGPRRAKTLRMNRRLAQHAATTDEADMGNRPGIEQALGFGDDVPRGCTCTCERCAAGDHSCGRLPCEEGHAA
jgi:hypothetical protein